MKIRRRIALVAVSVLSLALFAWGTIAGAEEVMGIVAAKGAAEIEVMDNLNPEAGSVMVAKAVTPDDAFVVVHLAKPDGMPGERLGYTRIEKGTSEDVEVKIEDVSQPATLIAAIHIDRGKKGELEFDMEDAEHSPDRPYFVEGMEVAMPFKIGKFGVDAAEGEAAIEVADQPGASGTLFVARAAAPTGAWIVVHLDDGGKPGDRVGLQQIAAGESRDVRVALDPSGELTDKLFVAVHADRGTQGTFDFDMMKKLDSADQPFFVDGEEVATAVTVR